MTENQKFNTVNHLACAKGEHPPHCNAKSAGNTAKAADANFSALTKLPADYEEQAKVTKALITAAQNGDKAALEKLCIFYEPLFRKEMRRDIFYNTLGYDEGLSLARLKFIETVMRYNGADYEHFAGYIRCRIHFALYDAAKKVWKRQTNEAALPAEDDSANISAFGEDVIGREEVTILLELALKKLTEKQQKTIKALYFEGYNGKELAEKLKITPAAVTKHHKQALNSLKHNIA